MEKAERLKKVFEFLRNKRLIKNQSDFAEKIGIVRSNMSAALSGDERYLTRSVFYKICEAFSQISYEYLNEGKGQMLTLPDIESVKDGGKPYYAVDFQGGFDLIFNDQTKNPDAYIYFPQFSTAECWVDISGKSMEPLISSGDIIALKKVEDWETNILYGEVYAIVTQQYRTVKRIRKSPDNTKILLIPENKDYDSQEIPKKNIIAIFEVLGAAKRIF